jgi:hypothetical protein
MTLLERAVVQVAAALESMGIDYMIVGGIANAVWGVPRATIDVDGTVAVENPGLSAAIDGLAGLFKTAVPDPDAFVPSNESASPRHGRRHPDSTSSSRCCRSNAMRFCAQRVWCSAIASCASSRPKISC